AYAGINLSAGRGHVRIDVYQLRRSRADATSLRRFNRIMKRVVAALIVREGKILVCQRTRHQTMPLKWEFPGGKIEQGEQPRDALVRELEEELGITAEIGDEVERMQHVYPNGTAVELRFFVVQAYQGELENKIFKDLQWAVRSQLT